MTHRRRNRREEELREEIESHLRMATNDLVEKGEAPDAAAVAARRELGNIGQIQESAVVYKNAVFHFIRADG